MSYKKTTGTYPSSDKEHQISYNIYTPDIPPVAVLQISHGMCEHIERYEEFAEYLTGHGIVVCGNDHLGHGSAVPEDRGFFGSSGGAGHLVDDIEELRVIMRRRYRSLPYILLGHSMGSFIVRAYIVKYKDTIDGVILSGTSGGDPRLKFGLFLTNILIKLRGERYRSRFVKRLQTANNNMRFKDENDSASWLTKDKEKRRIYNDDERCNFIFTLRGYNDLFRLLADVTSDQWALSVPKGLPVFIISGADDPIGDYGKGVQEVCDRLQDAEIYDLTMKLYPDCRHEILNETERGKVFGDIYDWIMKVREGVIECRTTSDYIIRTAEKNR
jgi:alpha-beta hydrolase superfamily lysophospholipase